MPGENFSRRVARAAAVGGGRSYRNQTPVGWYMILLVICLGGISLVAYSRYERTHPAAVASKKTPVTPPTKANLWEVGLTLDICGRVSNLPASTNIAQAYTTDGKGVVTIEPGRATNPIPSEGKNAILEGFLLPNFVNLTSTSLAVPVPSKVKSTTSTTTSTSSTSTTSTTTTTLAPTTTSTSSTSSSTSASTTTLAPTTTTTTVPAPKLRHYANGQRCAGKAAKVQVEVWKSPSAAKGTIVSGNPSTLRFKNGQLITIAFVPPGTTLPKPASKNLIAQFLLSNPTGIAPTAPVTTPSSLPVSSVPATSTATAVTTAPTTSPSVTATTTKGKKKKA